ncbi:hypothetical protein AVEN_146725-1 [Araneus ventricosus]|uniref:Uncharacterized protein n=1 Tax=Araneus ventricosus TaxID=182803 RepID=A0A4Y2UYC4_ARAVE|nr:hypothetical protein AVEN_146725-1 [Araneus ventricosus]
MTRTTPELAPLSKLPRHTNGRIAGLPQSDLMCNRPLYTADLSGIGSEPPAPKPRPTTSHRGLPDITRSSNLRQRAFAYGAVPTTPSAVQMRLEFAHYYRWLFPPSPNSLKQEACL